MFLNQHSYVRLRTRLRDGMYAERADHIIAALEAIPGDPGSIAIEVYRFGRPFIDDNGSNGDQVIAIARGGEVHTVMLRRSWNQPFTPEALNVDRVAIMAVGDAYHSGRVTE